MSGLRYSSNALNVLKDFYGADHVVYVEGEDDVVFWEVIFECLGFDSVKIEPKYGCSQLNDYQSKIESEGAKIIICRDADYGRYLNQLCEHPQVVYTAGHSIENSLVTLKGLANIVRFFSRSSANNIEEIIDETKIWMEQFEDSLEPLLVLEILCERENTGLKVLGKSCAKFMKSGTSHLPSTDNIKKLEEEILEKIPREKYEEFKKEINQKELPLFDVARGHFILTAAIRLINNQVKKRRKKISISAEDLFTNLIQNLQIHFDEHEHYSYYEREIKNATSHAS